MGKRHDALLHIALSCLILPSLLQVPMVASQPSQGDWIVTGVEVVENEMIVLNGNLTVKGGGSLTLRNVTLRLNVEENGQYGISVEPGGSLFIYDSNISSTTAFRFFFYVVDGRFVMKDSELRGAGWGEQWAYDTKNRGLYIEADNALIDGNFVSDGHSVTLVASRNSSIINNKLITDCGIAITHAFTQPHLKFPYFPDHNFILNNSIHGPVPFGIEVRAGNSNIIAHNIILDAMVGVKMHGSWHNIIANNRVIMEHHPGPWGGIALWGGCGNNTIANNTIQNFLKVAYGGGDMSGIEIVCSVNNRIEGNSIERVQQGVILAYSHNNLVANNVLSNVSQGTAGTYGFHIPSFDAIQLYHSSNNVVINNRISSSSAQSNAIILWDNASNNVLQANVINSSYYGISLHYSSDNNTIVNNAMSQILSRAMILDEAKGNIVYHNNFLDPVVDIYDNGLNNWSFGGEGNYWGDYEGQDIDGDGIGDVSRRIPPNGTDSFPLMNPKPVVFVPTPYLEPDDIPEMWAEGFVITAEETWENRTVTASSISVRKGATLTLRNMTLMMGLGFAPITVESGGAMYIYNSTITAADPRYGGYPFFIDDAREFVMKNSELHYAGFNFLGDYPGGLAIHTTNGVVTNVIIENNVFTHNCRAIYVAAGGGSPVRIVNNTIAYSYEGITHPHSPCINNTISKIIYAGVFSCGSPRIQNNNLSHVWRAAIITNHPGPDLVIMSNTISNSEVGILLFNKRKENAAGDITVVNNVINDAWRWAIQISQEYPSTNVVRNNTVSSCAGGIYLAPESHGTLIYHNNIINSPNSSDLGSNNWDYNGEGNYWSDYTGIDEDDDGIGDIHHSIPPNGIDHYPFMKPNGWILRAVIINPLNGSYLHEKVNITVVGNDPNFDRMELYVGGEQVKTWTESGVQTYRWDTTTLADGSYTLKLIVRDKAGNTKEAKVTVTIDNTAPSVNILSPQEEDILRRGVTISFIASDVNFERVELYLNRALTKTWAISGKQTFEWNSTTVNDGRHLIELVAYDKAGNAFKTFINVTIDNTPPILKIIQPAEGATIENTTITVTWSVNDITSGIAKLEISVNGGPWTDMTNKTGYTIKDMAEGSHTIKIRATDKVGNTAEKQTTFAVKLPIPYIGIAIAIAVIAITAIAALLIKRRR